MKNWKLWVAGIVSGAIGTATVVAYAFANFETKENAKEWRESMQGQLNRMEDKIDGYELPPRRALAGATK